MITRISHLPSRTIQLNNEDYLYFSGTSYLGIGHNKGFAVQLEAGLEKYGTIFSASRNNNLQLDIYKTAEDYLAEWFKSEAALTVTSGMLAGMLAVKYLNGATFLYVNQAHPAIWHNTPTQFFTSDNILDEVHRTLALDKKIVLATNAIDPLFCEALNFDWINALPNDARITILIDDSHGLGVCGETGNGHFELINKHLKNKKNIRFIVTASLAKAIGIPGGVILSDKNTITDISQSSFFFGASPIVPAYLFAFVRSKSIYSELLNVLRRNLNYFNQQCNESVKNLLLNQKGYPVYFVRDNGLYDFLFKNKIFISNFAYPKSTDKPITRIVLSALHTVQDLQMLINAMKEYTQKLEGSPTTKY